MIKNDQFLLDDRLICDEISKIGYKISSISDLVNLKKSYPKEIIPLLVKLLDNSGIKSNTAKEAIVRSLTIKEARGVANKTLIRLFLNTPPKNELFLWSIANTIGFIMDDSDFVEVIKIVSDKK